MRFKAIAKAGGGVVCAFVGLILCLREQIFPSYKTIEVSRGVFQEQWVSGRELWTGVTLGIGLLVLASYLFRSAYRGLRQARNAT